MAVSLLINSQTIQIECTLEFSLRKQQIISGLENIVSKAIYENANRIAEKLSEFLNTALINISFQILVFPMLIYNFYDYLTMDLVDDAFQWSFIFPYW